MWWPFRKKRKEEKVTIEYSSLSEWIKAEAKLAEDKKNKYLEKRAEEEILNLRQEIIDHALHLEQYKVFRFQTMLSFEEHLPALEKIIRIMNEELEGNYLCELKHTKSNISNNKIYYIEVRKVKHNGNQH